MQLAGSDSISLFVMVAYGFIILLYLVILRLLLRTLQQLTDNYNSGKTLVDIEIHRTAQSKIENSMHAFDISEAAMIVAKAVFTVFSMGLAIILVVSKLGYVITVVVMAGVLGLMWLLNFWMSRRDKAHDIRNDITRIIKKSASVGLVIVFGILLGVLLLLMMLLK